MSNFLNLIFLVSLFLLGCSPGPQPSSIQEIIANDGTEARSIEVIGRDLDSKVFYIGIGRSLHEVRDCATSEELLNIIDQEIDLEVPDVALGVLLNDEGYTQKSTLSCDSEVLPSPSDTAGELDQNIYISNSKLYLSSGVDHEYYRIDTKDSECAFSLFSTLFSLNSRQKLPSPPADLQSSRIIDLGCQVEKSPDYSLSWININSPDLFHNILVLRYQGSGSGSMIPIYKLNGQNLGPLDSPRIEELISHLKEVYRIKSDLGTGPISELFGQPLFDYCLSCDEEIEPNHVMFSIDIQPKLDTIDVSSKSRPNFLGIPIVEVSFDGEASRSFEGCGGSLLKNLSIPDTTDQATEFNYLASLTRSGKPIDLPYEKFDCPSAVFRDQCQIKLEQERIDGEDLNELITELGRECKSRELEISIGQDLEINLDRSIKIDHSQPFDKVVFKSGSSTRKTMTFVKDCSKFCTPGAYEGIKLRKKTLVLDRINLVLQIQPPESMDTNPIPKFDLIGINNTNTGNLILRQSNITVSKAGGLTYGIRNHDGGSIFCIDCGVSTRDFPIALKDGRITIFNSKESSPQPRSKIISSNGFGLHLTGASSMVSSGAHITSPVIAHFGYQSRGLFYDAELSLGSADVASSRAFRFATKNFIGLSTVEIENSKIFNLRNIDRDSFRFGDFNLSDGSTILSLNNIQFFLDESGEDSPADLSSILSCVGFGRISYQFKNYCSN